MDKVQNMIHNYEYNIPFQFTIPMPSAIRETMVPDKAPNAVTSWSMIA